MPEGHLVHRYARDHGRLLSGRRVRAGSPQGRFAAEAARLDGGWVAKVEAYGKHLFYAWDSGDVVHVHLGMRGVFLESDADRVPPPQVRLRLAAEERAVDLIAPATCELTDGAGRDAVVGRLGPDPLRAEASPAPVWERVRGSDRPIGALLLDQAVVAGIGNVLRAEGLFAAGLHPSAKGSELTRAEFTRLWRSLVRLMRRGMDEGRIITVRPRGRSAAGVTEDEGRFVYRQERCRRCGSAVQTWELAGRTAYACPRDQPLTGQT